MSENVFLFVFVCVWVSHLLSVRVEGDRHVEQQLPVFDSADKVLNSDLQVSGCLVDFLWVALSGLSQLLSCLQQLVCISVCVLKEEGGTLNIIDSNTINIIKTCISFVLYHGRGECMFKFGVQQQLIRFCHSSSPCSFSPAIFLVPHASLPFPFHPPDALRLFIPVPATPICTAITSFPASPPISPPAPHSLISHSCVYTPTQIHCSSARSSVSLNSLPAMFIWTSCLG